MDFKRFEELTVDQQKALVLAMQVRNAMEDFHVRHLNDAQMKQLNLIIRRALLEGLILFEQKSVNLGLAILMIPDYWEIPSEKEARKILREEENKILRSLGFSELRKIRKA